ncbi:hypothetical protein [Roseibium sp. SCP14]|uniref:hypothetical protein n=1 Tax=Roseibium sp. SCP14 TaxID=3141375 RepID=UPI003334DAE8
MSNANDRALLLRIIVFLQITEKPGSGGKFAAAWQFAGSWTTEGDRLARYSCRAPKEDTIAKRSVEEPEVISRIGIAQAGKRPNSSPRAAETI